MRPKTIPCPAASPRIAHIRELPPPPPGGINSFYLSCIVTENYFLWRVALISPCLHTENANSLNISQLITERDYSFIIQRSTEIHNMSIVLTSSGNSLHQEPGQKPGQPGKAWPGRAFRIFGQAYQENAVW